MNTLCVYDNVNDDENLWELTIKSKKLKQRKTACGCTLTKLFSTINANTPLAGFTFASKNMPEGVGRFSFSAGATYL